MKISFFLLYILGIFIILHLTYVSLIFYLSFFSYIYLVFSIFFEKILFLHFEYLSFYIWSIYIIFCFYFYFYFYFFTLFFLKTYYKKTMKMMFQCNNCNFFLFFCYVKNSLKSYMFLLTNIIFTIFYYM
jgi:hypothetical protein